MGCRKDARLAQSQPPSGKGFRGVDCERQSVGLHRLCAVAHQKISLTLTRSQVSYTTITIKIRTLRGACIQSPAEASSVCFITTTALSMLALINSANSFGKKSLIQTNRVRFSPSENTCTEALRVTKRPPGSA